MAKGLRKTMKKRASSKKVRVARRKTMKKTAGKRHGRRRGGATEVETRVAELKKLIREEDDMRYNMQGVEGPEASKLQAEIDALSAKIEKLMSELKQMDAAALEALEEELEAEGEARASGEY